MTGSAPRHLVVSGDGLVTCPGGTQRPYGDCYGCAALQGTLEGADLVMLCGHGAPAPPFHLRQDRLVALVMDRPPLGVGVGSRVPDER